MHWLRIPKSYSGTTHNFRKSQRFGVKSVKTLIPSVGMRLLERDRIEPAGQMKERKNRLQYTFFKDL